MLGQFLSGPWPPHRSTKFFPPALGIRVCLCLRACIFMCLYLYLAVGVLSHLYALTHVCSLSACALMHSQIESLIRPLSRSLMSHSHQLQCVTVSLLACWHPLTCFLVGCLRLLQLSAQFLGSAHSGAPLALLPRPFLRSAGARLLRC